MALDKMTKVLLVACFILVGALAFTTGILLTTISHKGTIIYPFNNTTVNNTSDQETSTSGSTNGEWNVSFCPYCGAPFHAVEEIPRYIDSEGIMHGDIYRVYECGHRVYMGEKTWRFYNFEPESQEYYREYIRERGGEVNY